MNFSTNWVDYKSLFDRWRNMMNRCYDPDCAAFPNYGGRGIKVCDRWHNPLNYVQELPVGFFKGAHLDRIDNDGDYEPSNMRWVTARENHNNRRSCVMITHSGKTQSISQWAREIDMNPATLHTRLTVWNWPIERALTTPTLTAKERMTLARNARYKDHVKKPTPPKRNIPQIEYNGEIVTLRDLSKRCGVPRKMLYKRLFERGWPVEKAVQPVRHRR